MLEWTDVCCVRCECVCMLEWTCVVLGVSVFVC